MWPCTFPSHRPSNSLWLSAEFGIVFGQNFGSVSGKGADALGFGTQQKERGEQTSEEKQCATI
jgi:hypothetical protein